MSHPFFVRHKPLLDQALAAISNRGYWSAFPESPSPKVYGEGAAEAAKAALDALLHKPFSLELPEASDTIVAEMSPDGSGRGSARPNADLDPTFVTLPNPAAPRRAADPGHGGGARRELTYAAATTGSA